MNRLYSPWPQNRILFICPAKTHNYRLRVSFWSFCDGAPGSLCQIKESLSLLKQQDKINPTCVLCVSSWVFRTHDNTSSGVFTGCMLLCTCKFKFSPRFSWFYLFTFPELCPGISFLVAYTPLHIWLHAYFHGFLFPIKQKPCTSSSASLRGVAECHTDPLGAQKGVAPSLGLHGFCWFPFFGAEIHGCIPVPLNYGSTWEISNGNETLWMLE